VVVVDELWPPRLGGRLMAWDERLTPDERNELARLEEHEQPYDPDRGSGGLSDRQVELIRKAIGPSEPMTAAEVERYMRKVRRD
jgi:hypothetical protein